jgi:hypothetical protein
MLDAGVHLHREQAPPALPDSIAACHATLTVLLDPRDATALRRLLAGCREVRLFRMMRRPTEPRVRAEVECLAGTAETLMARIEEAAARSMLGPVTAYVRRGAIR